MVDVKHDNGNTYTLIGSGWTVEDFVRLKEKHPTSQVLMTDKWGEKYLAQFKCLEVVK